MALSPLHAYSIRYNNKPEIYLEVSTYSFVAGYTPMQTHGWPKSLHRDT
jgi:hypothetical protein